MYEKSESVLNWHYECKIASFQYINTIREGKKIWKSQADKTKYQVRPMGVGRKTVKMIILFS